jgi:predicted ribonuclease YlaK
MVTVRILDVKPFVLIRGRVLSKQFVCNENGQTISPMLLKDLGNVDIVYRPSSVNGGMDS